MRASFLRPSCWGLSLMQPPRSVYIGYTQLPAEEGERGGEGGDGGYPTDSPLTDSYVQKTYSFHWQQIPSKKPSAVPFSVFEERLNVCCLSQRCDFWREPTFQFKCDPLERWLKTLVSTWQAKICYLYFILHQSVQQSLFLFIRRCDSSFLFIFYSLQKGKTKNNNKTKK